MQGICRWRPPSGGDSYGRTRGCGSEASIGANGAIAALACTES